MKTYKHLTTSRFLKGMEKWPFDGKNRFKEIDKLSILHDD